METGTGRVKARQAGILLFGRTLAAISEAVVPILIIRLLDKDQVGVLSSVLVLYSSAALILSTGFPSALFYFLPTRERHERGAIARQVSWVMTGLGAALGATLWLVGSGAGSSSAASSDVTFDPVAFSLMAALALYPLGDVPSRLLPNLLVIEERTKAAAAFGIVKAVGVSLATLIPILLGWSLHGVLWCVSLFGLVQGAWLVISLRRLYPGTGSTPSPVTFRELLRFSLPLGLTDIVSMLNNRLDRYLVGLSFPAARFAEYHAGAFQVPVIVDIPYSVGRVYSSEFARLFSQNRAREAMQQWRLSIHKVSLIVVPCSWVMIVAAEECMELLFTAAYLDAANVFRLYSVLMLGRVTAYGSVIVAAGRPKLVVHAAIVTILSNLVLSIPCLYLFGFIGPALGTALALIPSSWFYCYCIARATGLSIRDTFPLFAYCRIVLLGVVASVPAVLFKLWVPAHPALALLAITALILVGFGALGTLTRHITSSDWQFVRRTLRGRFSTA